MLARIRTDMAQRTRPAKVVAVLADPVFRPDDSRVTPTARTVPSDAHARGPADDTHLLSSLQRSADEVGLASGGNSFPRLRATRREAERILALAPPDRRLAAVDFEASRATASSPALGEYRIVHIATHGLLNTLHPELSGLVLSLVAPDGSPQDGFLRLHDIFNLELPVDLVVLSACQTGLGQDVKGEGIIGLTRGFIHAGAARVVVSLWNVDDDATAALMERFYQGMIGPAQLSPAAALRAAQLDLSRQPRWRSPYYWAGFTLHGEFR